LIEHRLRCRVSDRNPRGGDAHSARLRAQHESAPAEGGDARRSSKTSIGEHKQLFRQANEQALRLTPTPEKNERCTA
jgi:hypothetical protein